MDPTRFLRREYKKDHFLRSYKNDDDRGEGGIISALKSTG